MNKTIKEIYYIFIFILIKMKNHLFKLYPNINHETKKKKKKSKRRVFPKKKKQQIFNFFFQLLSK